MPFRAQGNDRLRPRSIARDRLRRVVLEKTRENKPCLQLCQRHPNTSTWATSEGEIRSGRDLLPVRRIPALRFEHLRILPNIRQAMNDPLTQDDQRTNWQTHSIQFELFR